MAMYLPLQVFHSVLYSVHDSERTVYYIQYERVNTVQYVPYMYERVIYHLLPMCHHMA